MTRLSPVGTGGGTGGQARGAVRRGGRSSKVEYRAMSRATTKPMKARSMTICVAWMRRLASVTADMLPVPVVSVPRAK